jgi:hypothetical protein
VEPHVPGPTGARGWFRDPAGRYELRWYNGERWTGDVAVDGRRYVDPYPIGTRRPRASATTAVLALVLGLVSVTLAWMPFMFVLAIPGAIAAFVLGVVALRRIRVHRASGRRRAIAGIVLAPLALALSPVGVLLTRATVREFEAFLEPGAHDVRRTTCTLSAGVATVGGTITNLDDEERSYVVVVELVDGRRVVARGRTEVDDVAPGATATWSATRRIGELQRADELVCRVAGVDGPPPFGLD